METMTDGAKQQMGPGLGTIYFPVPSGTCKIQEQSTIGMKVVVKKIH